MSTKMPNNADNRYEMIALPGADPGFEPPLRILRRIFRGRYHWLVPLTIVGGAIGAAAGWLASPPRYESAGMLQMVEGRENVLYDSDANDRPPGFRAHVNAQLTILQSRELMSEVVKRDDVAALGWTEDDASAARLSRMVQARLDRSDPLITLAVAHPDPATARTLVNAVIATYVDQYGDPDRASLAAREETLRGRESDLLAQIEATRTAILDQSNQYGYDAIVRMHEQKVAALVALENRLLRAESGPATRIEAADLDLDGRIPDELERKLASLDEQEFELAAEMQSLEPRYGPNHPIVRNLRHRIEVLRIERDLRRKAILGGNPTVATAEDAPTADATDGPGANGAVEIDAPQTTLRTVQARDALRAEAAALGAQRIALANLVEQEKELSDRLAETRQRLDELRVESARDTRRVQVVAWGELPVAPVTDRRKGLATAGLLMGVAGCGGALALVALLCPRLRFVEELERAAESREIIGILPDLEAHDAQAAGRAARAVHQLRNLVELKTHDPDRNVSVITSCGHGEGKTSLALAMATSSATSERRTLLIDADVGNPSLTRELGLVGRTGLCEAIGPAHETGQVHATRHANLYAMPIGSSRGLDPEDLSHSRFAQLLDALRPRFDMIIIDTGPMLGSVEASLCAAHADHVLLVVERNQRQDLLHTTLQRLAQITAPVAGIVFNRAVPTEFRNQAAPPRAANRHGIARLVPHGRHGDAEAAVTAIAGTLHAFSDADPGTGKIAA